MLATALGTLDTDTAKLLAEFTEAGLVGTRGLSLWRNLMTAYAYPHVSQWRAQALAQGRAQAIVHILDKRHILLTPEDRQRILSCADMPTLDLWLDRALTASSAEEFFPE